MRHRALLSFSAYPDFFAGTFDGSAADCFAVFQPIGVPHSVAIAFQIDTQRFQRFNCLCLRRCANVLIQPIDVPGSTNADQFLQLGLGPGSSRFAFTHHGSGAFMEILTDMINVHAPTGFGAEPLASLLPDPRRAIGDHAEL